jgi:cell division protein FtsQ
MSNRRRVAQMRWLHVWWPYLRSLRHARAGAIGAPCGVALAAALWYGAPAALRWVTSHPYFALTTIEIDGNRRLSRDEILQNAGVRIGSSVWDATPSIVRPRLQSHPWIRRVSVRREFPDRLMITVQERRPVAIARLATLSYVDRDGHVLDALHDDDSRDFPLITGLESADAADFRNLGIHRALQFLRRYQRTNCFEAVSEIHVDRQRGITVFPLRTAVAVVLGWGSWREKLAHSARVFAAWEGQMGRVVAVDVSFRDLVVVKLREERHPTVVRSSKHGVRV